ncbi:MAG: NADH-quinone oxidoreductase subunit NuoN [Magnetococcales bacterium]|nr:NADH-quinone oxidoreductase subunit NuoN [Magnetococcales bacterium]
MPVQMPDIDLSLLLPEIIITLAGAALLLASAWLGKDGQRKIGLAAIAAIAVAALFSIVGGNGQAVETTFGGFFVADYFSVFMKVLMYLATIMAILLGWDYSKRIGIANGEFYVLTLFSLLGAMIMASSGDFLTLYLGLELMSLSIYILAAYRRDDPKSNEAGLKYFLLGSLASGLLLYGISMIYGNTGTTLFSELPAILQQGHLSAGLGLGLVLVIAGLAFKIAAAPFHMWAPDVYEGAPTSVTAFMAVLPKLAAFAAIYRILPGAFGHLQEQWSTILQLLALLSLAVGAFAAIVQTNIKRMLAYSSIGHVGYALIGLAAGGAEGFQAVLVYLAIYIFMNLGAFALILVLNHDGEFGESITDYKGLAHKRPLLGFLMAMFMFSMAGIPPLAGFVGKFYVFMAAVKSGMLGVAIMGVLFSAVGAFYYLRIVKFMYFDQAEDDFKMPVTSYSRVVIAVSSFVVLVWGIFPGYLLSWTEASIQNFL